MEAPAHRHLAEYTAPVCLALKGNIVNVSMILKEHIVINLYKHCPPILLYVNRLKFLGLYCYSLSEDHDITTSFNLLMPI